MYPICLREKGLSSLKKTDKVDEDALMEAALENGAEDMITHEDAYEVQTTTDTFGAVSEALKSAGYEFVEADIEYVPSMESTPTNEHDIKNLRKMIDVLEENDDVQKVYNNCSIDLEEEE